ncbi:acetyl/propionyl/methylcrotonyl-CoA carboxylase subunit alpha [Asticcacaulis machinosus]|uniref:Biotin carboxylase N-terminal domain-containing protein n=1 Tax=Asticcacaulis machinosus TaxID=2984211 RepID=A0ABT5HK30_9CAUL|nr:biotin carboxylase N-terminal domain-containing protein [Asticcacaulis machinosus]MDC7676605.1 biotin carboxylase N-terminal domain-containing protein [Asticcacaulis machinosus]
MSKTVRKLLIANRGEIACRIIRTCQRMGIRTVAVYSDTDARALFVQQADEAYALGGVTAAETYLRGDRIIDIAKACGADAIHPGYGFLSENAEFAKMCAEAGLIFVGPSPESMRAMALKGAAKALMEAAGVPVTPGYHGDDQSLQILQQAAERIGYPVLIKAVAGGGGKGMRRVDSSDDFASALAAAQAEGQKAFGDPKVLIEKYITRPRHVEVQVFGDRHGQVVHLYDRDCSMQRRHQKVIEEAPAPDLSVATRHALHSAAVRAAQAIHYHGAGTIEFILDTQTDDFYFMEMNTRLQVEHPVTEMITGLDMVEWQIRVARGEPLPLTQDQITQTGHALEARLYAENPEVDFMPSAGRLTQLEFSAQARIDSGVQAGDEISIYFDPMIAKLIVHGKDRAAAIAALRQALIDTRVEGLTSNLSFLRRLISAPAFTAGEIDTGFIERHREDLMIPWPDIAQHKSLSDPNSPWDATDGWWLNQPPVSPPDLRRFNARKDYRPTGPVAIEAPMPGAVVAIEVFEHARVTKGQPLLVLEAMKLQHTLKAPCDGIVTELSAAIGQQVRGHVVLMTIIPFGDAEPVIRRVADV